MPIIECFVPILTKSESNLHEHHMVYYKRRKKQMQTVRAIIAPLAISLPCSITFVRCSPRTMDFDNLVGSFKGFVDAICQHILGGRPGQKDSDPRITWKYEQMKCTSKEKGTIIFFEFDLDNQDLQTP